METERERERESNFNRYSARTRLHLKDGTSCYSCITELIDFVKSLMAKNC
jgi:hypothetical protein